MARSCPLLLITADELLAAAAHKAIEPYARVVWARTGQSACDDETAALGVCGVICDFNMLQEDGFEIAKRLRRHDPGLLVLGVASRVTTETINTAQAARVELLIRPFSSAHLVAFVHRAIASSPLPDENVCAWVVERADALHLTRRDLELIAHAVRDESRETMLRQLRISQNTLKSQVRSLLRKFGARNLDELANSVLREASRLKREECSAMLANAPVQEAAPSCMVR
jgi:DNA-binding NarL/FixJ family response regulator